MADSEYFKGHISEEDLATFKSLEEIGFVDLDKVKEYRGRLFSPGFSTEALEYFNQHWEPEEGDVIVSGFPKTGTVRTR